MTPIRKKLRRRMMNLMVGGVQAGNRLRYASTSGYAVDFGTLRGLEQDIAVLAPGPSRTRRRSVANRLRPAALQIQFLQFSRGEKCHRAAVGGPKGSIHQ